MLDQKIQKYLSNSGKNAINGRDYKLRNDGNGAFIEYWNESNIGVPQPTDLQINAISEADALKQSIIPQIKEEASKRIVAAYPEWKQRNHMAAVVDTQNKELIALKANTTYTLSADELAIVAAAQAAKTEIFNIRAKSDELEASLDTMTQEQLEAFDATNDSNWV